MESTLPRFMSPTQGGTRQRRTSRWVARTRRELPPATIISIAILFLALATPKLRAALIDEFRSQYPATAARIEDAYSHVTITDHETIYGPPGQLQSVQSVEYMRDGDLIRVTDTASQSADSELPAGSTLAFGGSRERFFTVRRATASGPFALEEFRPRSNFDFFVRTHAKPLFAPYCVYEKRITDLLFRDKERVVTITAVEPAVVDGVSVVQVVAEFTVSGNVQNKGLKQYHFYFAPKTWLLVGWRFAYNASSRDSGTANCRIRYQSDSEPPRLQSVEYWGDDPSTPGLKYNNWQLEVTSFHFGSAPPSKFSLASFGLKEPAPPGNQTRFRWAVIIDVPILILAGIGFVLLAHRYRRRAA